MTDEAIFEDVSNTIRRALEEVYAFNPKLTHISTAALELALGKLMGQEAVLEVA
jgi:hypothetical protein